MSAVNRICHIIPILMVAGVLLPGTGCAWRKPAHESVREDTRPEPKLKKSPYTVNGRRYRPMGIAEALQYNETGEASLYNGDNTMGALGERLPKGGMYAAHRTLPLPCIVKVTGVESGKSCLVRVCDRGPFNRRRIIDISPAVARAIGFHRWGVVQVNVETVSVGDGPNQRKKK